MSQAKPRKPKDQFLPGLEKVGEKQFGGTLLKGNPREQRPISTKKPMHLVLRSTQARGERSFLAPGKARKIEATIHKAAKNHGVKVWSYSNVGNHLHLAVQPQSRKSYNGFIRSISGIIARIALGRERRKAGATPLRKIKFWDMRPFTRILEWGRDFNQVKRYIFINTMEGWGAVQRKPKITSTA